MMKEIEEDLMMEEIVVPPFGMTRRNGRLICWLCEEEEERHCVTDHQQRLQGLVEHPLLLLFIMTRNQSSIGGDSSTWFISGKSTKTKYGVHTDPVSLSERSITAKNASTPLHSSNNIKNNDQEGSSSITQRTTRPLALLSPEDANYEWRCELCGVYQMRSQEYWDHCLTVEHLERRQTTQRCTTDTGTMKDRTNHHRMLDMSELDLLVAEKLPSSPGMEKENGPLLEEPMNEPNRDEYPIIVTPTEDKKREGCTIEDDGTTLNSSAEEQTAHGDNEDEDMFDGMSVLQTPSPVKPPHMVMKKQADIPSAISFSNETNTSLMIWTDSLRKVIDDTKRSEDWTPLKDCHQATVYRTLEPPRVVGPNRPKNLLAALDHDNGSEDDDLLCFATTSQINSIDDNASNADEKKLRALLNELALC